MRNSHRVRREYRSYSCRELANFCPDKSVIAVIAKHNLILAAGHIAPEEVLPVFRERCGEGICLRSPESHIYQEPGAVIGA